MKLKYAILILFILFILLIASVHGLVWALGEGFGI